MKTSKIQKKEEDLKAEVPKVEELVEQSPGPVFEGDSEDETQSDITQEQMLALCKNFIREIETAKHSTMKLPDEIAYEKKEALNAFDPLIEEVVYANHLSERRRTRHPCEPKTGCKVDGFEDPFINATSFMFGKVEYIVAQTPLTGTELSKDVSGAIFKPERPKKSTIEKHCALIVQKQIACVSVLCSEKDMDDNRHTVYFSETVGEELQFGRYKVKTLEAIVPTTAEDFILFKLEISQEKTPKKYQFELVVYAGWPDYGAPMRAKETLRLLTLLGMYKKNVMIQSWNGLGRAGTLIAIKYGIKKCLAHFVPRINDLIQEVRTIRNGAVQSAEQLMFTILAITEGIMKIEGIGFLEDHVRLQFYHQRILSGKYLVHMDQHNPYTQRISIKGRKEKLEQDEKDWPVYLDAWKKEYEERMMRTAKDVKSKKRSKLSGKGSKKKSGKSKKSNKSKKTKKTKKN